MNNNQYMNEREVSKLTGLSLGKLRMDRFKNQGLPYYKIGRAVRYKAQDIEEHFNQNRVSPAGDA